MNKPFAPLNEYQRNYWKAAFKDMSKHERQRVKQLLRRRAILAIAEIWGRKPHNPRYWELCTKEIKDILYHGKPNWSLSI